MHYRKPKGNTVEDLHFKCSNTLFNRSPFDLAMPHGDFEKCRPDLWYFWGKSTEFTKYIKEICRLACSDGLVVLGAATDCTLSLTTAWVRIPAWACEKVASNLGLGGGFRRVLQFPPLLTTYTYGRVNLFFKSNTVYRVNVAHIK